jgi:hypothetical protein
MATLAFFVYHEVDGVRDKASLVYKVDVHDANDLATEVESLSCRGLDPNASWTPEEGGASTDLGHVDEGMEYVGWIVLKGVSEGEAKAWIESLGHELIDVDDIDWDE